jgi:hypothetical protein
MELRDAVLYHQVHPAKLATDITSEVAMLWLLWRRRPWLALLVTFVPPILASYLVIRYVRLEPIRDSRLGAYLRRWMTPGAQAARGAGAVVTAPGAWYHAPAAIAAGLAVVLAAWFRGLLGRIG